MNMNHSEPDTREVDESLLGFEDVPDTLSTDSAICIAKPAPLAEYAVPLRITDRYTDRNDCRIIVTPSIGTDETVRQQQTITPSGDYRMGIVDTTADEHLDALYQENPTIYLPHPGELSQISLAVWDLYEALSSSCSNTHVILRSLTPLLAEKRLERVTNVLERLIEHQRAHSNRLVFGIEYTEHDEATMAALRDLVDGIVWIEQASDRSLRLEYRRARTDGR